MKWSSTLVLVLGLVLVAAGCGGGGGNGGPGEGGPGIDFDPGLNYINEGDLTVSQKDALRDIGLYGNVEEQFVNDSSDTESGSPSYESMNSLINIPKKQFMNKTIGAAKNLKDIAVKTPINESETQVVQGANGVGSMTIKSSCSGEGTNDLLDVSCDFTANAENYDANGACSQIVHTEGLLTCHVDMYADSSGKYSVAGYCLISDDMIFAGTDGVQHKVTMAYGFEANGNSSSGAYSESEEGWVKIDGASIKFEDMTKAPVCTNPSVVKCNPEDGSSDALTDAGIALLFDQEMDHASVEQAFSLESYNTDSYEYAPVAGDFSWDGATMLFTPSQPLEYSTEYRVNLAGGTDALGYPILSTFSSVFTTAGYPITVSEPISITGGSYDILGMAWDGSVLWILDGSDAGVYLYKIDANGDIDGSLKSVSFADYYNAEYLEWDGANFWSIDEGESPNQLVKLTTEGSEIGSVDLGGGYYDGLTFTNGNFSIYDSSSDKLITLDASGTQLSQKTITGGYYATVITWCGDSYWMFYSGYMHRINSELSSVNLSVNWLDTYEPVTDATCDSANKIIWVAVGWNNQEIYKIQLP